MHLCTHLLLAQLSQPLLGLLPHILQQLLYRCQHACILFLLLLAELLHLSCQGCNALLLLLQLEVPRVCALL
jgi:hypothetical protein